MSSSATAGSAGRSWVDAFGCPRTPPATGCGGWSAGASSPVTARVVDPAALGRSLEALISVRLAPNSDAGQLEERLAAWPEVEEAVHVTGRFDFELKVSTSGPRGLDDLLVGMKRELGVAETETRLVLRRIVPGASR